MGGQGGEGHAHHPYQAEHRPRGDLYVLGGEGVIEEGNKGVQHPQVLGRGDVQLAMLQAHLHVVCVRCVSVRSGVSVC